MDTDNFQGTADEAQAARDALDLAAYRLHELMEAGNLPLPPHAIALSPPAFVLVVLGVAAVVAGIAYVLHRRRTSEVRDIGRFSAQCDFDRFRSGYSMAGGDATALAVLDEFGETVLGVTPPPRTSWASALDIEFEDDDK